MISFKNIFFKKLFYVYITYIYVCAPAPHAYMLLWGPEGGITSHATGVVDSCRSHMNGLFEKISSALNYLSSPNLVIC